MSPPTPEPVSTRRAVNVVIEHSKQWYNMVRIRPGYTRRQHKALKFYILEGPAQLKSPMAGLIIGTQQWHLHL
jgi:hypothetical protein